MSRLLRRAGLRHLGRHPWQLVLSVLGVALGVAVVVAVDLANGSALRAFELAAEAVAGEATHRVIGPEGVPEALYRELRLAGVRRSAPVVEGPAVVAGPPQRALRLLGVDPFAEAEFRPYLGARGGAGIDLAAFLTEPGAVVLAATTAAELGLATGDGFAAEIAGRPHRLRLVGVFDPADRLQRGGAGELLLADLATAQELLGGGGRLSRIDLILEGDEAAAELARRLPAGVRLEPAGAGAGAAAQMTGAFRLNLQALSLLALLCGAFLIYNTLSFAVVRRRKLFGTLRCLGASRRQILGLVLAEAAAIGGLGALAGVAAGALLAGGLTELVTRTINDLYFAVAVRGVTLAPATLAKGGALGLGASLLAALAPAAEAVSVPPRSALARSELEGRVHRLVPAVTAGGVALAAAGALLLLPDRGLGLTFTGLFAVLIGAACLTPVATIAGSRLATGPGRRWFGQLGGLAARGVEASLSRTGVAVAALALAVAVTVGVDVMIRSFRTTVSGWLDYSLPADLYVSLYTAPGQRLGSRQALGPEVVTAIRRLPGVDGVNTLRHFEVGTAQGPLRGLALDLDPRSRGAFRFRDRVAADPWPDFEAGGTIFVSEPLAYRQRLAVGDELVLPTPSGDRALPIAGIYYDYASEQGAVLIGRRLYEGLWSDRGATGLSIHAAPGADRQRLRAALAGLLAGARAPVIRDSRELREASLEVFDRTFLITGVLRLLAVGVAFFGVLSALMALAFDRARELGVLRALGLTPGQLWLVVTGQTGLLGAIAGLLALPLGWLVAALMVAVVNRRSFGWSLELEAAPQAFAAALCLAVGAALLAGLYPAWRMARTSPAAALREE